MKFTLYTTSWCPDCLFAKKWLNEMNVDSNDYQEVDIGSDPEAARKVEEINGGYKSVPTFYFADESTLTEPSRSELEAKLKQLDLF